ncbi:MAG: cyanophycin synthetase, partial [Parabacteroides sp.]|nr:cyanophycin synthetase [Parabacteroides sp.]
KQGIHVTPRLQEGVKFVTYTGVRNSESEKCVDDVDFYAENVRIGNGEIVFDFVGPDVRIDNILLGVPVRVNIENGVAAIAVAWLNGLTAEEIRKGMASFAGPNRRFDFHLKKENAVLIDDYAHHPAELKASILSVKELYAGRKVTGIFQPHLYTRTRDFAAEFAASLSLLDELILLDIYPARELPIPGITS